MGHSRASCHSCHYPPRRPCKSRSGIAWGMATLHCVVHTQLTTKDRAKEPHGVRCPYLKTIISIYTWLNEVSYKQLGTRRCTIMVLEYSTFSLEEGKNCTIQQSQNTLAVFAASSTHYVTLSAREGDFPIAVRFGNFRDIECKGERKLVPSSLFRCIPPTEFFTMQDRVTTLLLNREKQDSLTKREQLPLSL